VQGVTRAMMNMNRQMKLPEIQKIMQEFEKQSEIMDMKEEMMNDVIGKYDFNQVCRSGFNNLSESKIRIRIQGQ
jgi:hypothetical protein